MPKGRAETDEQKKAVMAKLLKAWKASPLQRLGQLLSNATLMSGQTELFYVEDESLVEKVVEFVGCKTLPPKSRYTHDCDSCLFLGADDKHDFYFCPQEGKWNSSVIARYGDNGADYTSGLESAIQHEKNFPGDKEYPLVKALKLARQRGLIGEPKH